MADTKLPVKKATPKKVTKAEKSDLSIHDQLVSKRMELMDYRKSHAAGELVNPRAITHTRKQVARLLTTIRAEATAQKESK